MVPHAVFTALKDALNASHKPTLPEMRLGRYEKASWGTAYFLRDVSLTSPKMGFYGKVLTTGTWLRIPRESCHQFHAKVATDPIAKLPPIPSQTCR
jgi:hypothetical protein